ncbi:SDR family NAD(P)-dependent oxidoreductase [Lachnoclostridium sp. Marseille-P6806]|uniref:SDR family NAD(P)-dependent oxidoreductase n=1 Tax=Lachnoclostridium sp. Marseille-P6806 TaxID=2364793 RepID=UPI001F5F40C7|nr:SDR family NAD(P)-dependent oxidoreductase [Lachnoclostridium sp. Marseille-P6806]
MMRKERTVMEVKGCAVITGASSGIGRELARRLAAEGWPLVLCARREEALRALAVELEKSCGVHCGMVAADLGTEEGTETLLRALEERELGVFVNCAGFGLAGSFAETELSRELEMLDVNVRAVLVLTKHVLRRMKAQGHGCLLNVASSAGLLPAGPFLSAYYASKAYAASLTQAIHEELREEKSPVRVSCLCPGPVDTEFNAVANVRFALPGITAAYCADCALRGLARGQAVIVPSLRMKLAVAGARFVPRGLLVRLTAGQQRKKL